MSILHRRRLFLPALFLFAGLNLHAQVTVENGVLAAGGVVAENGTTRLSGTFGQAIIGAVAAPGAHMSQGFWFARQSGVSALADEPVAGDRQPQLQCAPNPVSLSATVSVSLPRMETATLALHDLLGREVMSLNRSGMTTGTATYELDTRELPEGHYTLVLTSGTDRQTLPVHIVR